MGRISEEIRLRYLYRDLILKGKFNVSFEAARKIVGPDCAFHLYSRLDAGRRKTAMNSGHRQRGGIPGPSSSIA